MGNKNKALGNSLEQRVVVEAQAKGLDAQRQPGSGVFKDYPHDAVVEQYLVECKVRSSHVAFSGSRMFSFDLDWLKGVLNDAVKHGFRSGVVVFRAKASTQKYVVLTYENWLDLLRNQRADGDECLTQNGE